MNKMKLLVLSGIVALAGPAFAQLTVNPIATSALASSLQSDNALLGNLTENTVSFESGGFLWEQQANFALGDFIVGNDTEGAFYADVSFLGRDALPLNNFGVNDVTIWNDYTPPGDFPVSYRVGSEAFLAVDFFFATTKPGYEGTWYHDDASTFRTWTSFDSEAAMLYVLFGIDDLHGAGNLGTDDNDYNDGAFLLGFNLEPVDFENAVPEPSTYGLIGAVALVGIVYLRQRKTKQLSAAS